jgi:ankyrin repeat protein
MKAKPSMNFAGSRLDVLNSNGESPLHCAVRSGHVDIIRILIERGKV